MSTQWITDRLPTLEDALEDFVLVWDESKAILWTYYVVEKGQPWAPIHKLIAPYVKPKRWKVRWDANAYRWYIVSNYDGLFVATLLLDADALATAQRICDIFNEVLP